MKTIKLSDYKSVEEAALAVRPTAIGVSGVENDVMSILMDVMENGDEALVKYTEKFDGIKLGTKVGEGELPIRVRKEEIENAAKNADPKLVSALEEAARNIRIYHENQLEKGWSIDSDLGSKVGLEIRPMERVALYVPGGTAAYPSTMLMDAVPAIIAGVPSIFIITPPGPDGRVNEAVLTAASILGIDEIYRVGGAQSVGAAAYGTDTIKKAVKIVGPGNKYVATAKKLVFGTIDIDMIAGPSEVLIIADNTADPVFVASDLLAQAEHDVDAGMFLVAVDQKGDFSFVEKVVKELERQMEYLPRKEILTAAIDKNLFICTTTCYDEAVAFSNEVAPEHLEIEVADPEPLIPKVMNAGSIFIGAYTPEAVGDYFAGTNHTLPTSGTAKFSSPLGVYDFVKRIATTRYTKEALNKNGHKIITIANAEGLYAHANSVKVRLDKMDREEE